MPLAESSEITVSIERIHNEQFQGYDFLLDLFLSNPDLSLCMKSFDLRIQYDGRALAYQSASLSETLRDCGWGSLSVTATELPDSTSALRVTARAADSIGPCRPIYFLNGVSDVIATLKFRVSTERRFNCTFVPIHFAWLDCQDNVLSSLSSDTSNRVLDVMYWIGDDSVGHVVGAPGYSGPSDSCPASPLSRNNIHYMNGGVSIVCSDSIGNDPIYGDLDLNGRAYEIEDVILYTQYFIYGLDMFWDVDSQTVASEANLDNEFLTTADVVYMVRILTCDAPVYSQLQHHSHTAVIDQQDGILTITSDVEVGAVSLVFSGAAEPELLYDEMYLKYDIVSGNLGVLIWSDGKNWIPAGTYQMLQLGIETKLKEAQAATYNGEIMNVEF